MPLAIKAILLALFIMTPALAFLTLLPKRLDSFERIFAALLLGCALVGLSSLVLALARAYSLTSLLLAVLPVSLAVMLIKHRGLFDVRVSMREAALPLIIIIAAALLLSPPSRIAFGGFDVGIYANVAAEIQREGVIEQTDSIVPLVAAERRAMLYQPNDDPELPYVARQVPGYYILDYETGRVIPQFFHLWPAFMAVFGSFLGIENMFWAVICMAVMALLGLYLLARRLLGFSAAVVAVLLAALSLPMIYFAKYSTSEMMDLAFFLGAILLLTAYLDLDSADHGMAIACGVLFSLGMLIRIDFIFVVVPLSVLFLYRLLRQPRRNDLTLLALLAAGLGISVAYGFVFAAPYTSSIIHWREIARFLPLLALLAPLALAFLFRKRAGKAFDWLAGRRLWLAGAGVFVLGGTFLYLYFIRPHGADAIVRYIEDGTVSGPSYLNQSIVRWGWYLSPLGLVLSGAGYLLWLLRERRFRMAPPWLIGIMFTLLFAFDIRHMPEHMLVMRRIMPVVFPLAMIMVVYCVRETARFVGTKLPMTFRRLESKHLAAAALIIPLIAFYAMTSMPALGLDEGGNQLAVTAELASEVAPDAVVLVTPILGAALVPTLQHFQGVDAARLTSYEVAADPEFRALLTDLSQGGRDVYLVWDNLEPMILAEGVEETNLGNLIWSVRSLEKTLDHRPEELVEADWHFTLYHLCLTSRDDLDSL
ncbi:MAG: glycosyltransferase family 39 protein [Candidatus Geothermincolia bacterium]